MPRINRTADVALDWCIHGLHFAPAKDFRTYPLKDGRMARRSYCRKCASLHQREWVKSGGLPGPRNGLLTDSQRDAIRARWRETAKQVAADYGVHRNTVYEIWSGRA